MQDSRVHSIDVWKGIAILAVIAIHAMASPSTFTSMSGDWKLALLGRQVVNFAIPMFLAIAGYLAGSKKLSTTAEITEFWRGRIGRIAPAYLVWTFLAVAMKSPSHLADPLLLARDVFLGEGIGIGYFVILLLQYVALTPLIARLTRTWHHVAVMCLVTIFGLVVRYVTAMALTPGWYAQFPIYALPFFAWYPFYHLGFWVRREGVSLDRWRKVSLILVVVFAAVSMAEAWGLAEAGLVEFALSQVKLSSFLMSGAFALAALSMRDTWASGGTLLAWLGRNSYVIYLSHWIFLAGARRIMEKLGQGDANQLAWTVAVMLMTVGASVLLVWLLSSRHVIGLSRRFLGVVAARVDGQ